MEALASPGSKETDLLVHVSNYLQQLSSEHSVDSKLESGYRLVDNGDNKKEGELIVKGWKPDELTINALIHSIPLSQLSKLSFWKVELREEEWEALLSALNTSSSITDVAFDCIKGIDQLLLKQGDSNMLSRLLKVETLSLRSNYLQDAHAQVLSEYLQENKMQVKHLSLWDNSISDEGAVAIGQALRSNKTLLSLSLGMNKISNTGGEYLALSIGKFKLTSQQLFERRKTIRELEKRKQMTISRRKRVNKGKFKKQAAAAKPEEGNTPTTVRKTASPAPSADLDPEDFDALIEELKPVEVDGSVYGKGNRSLLHLNLSHNFIQPQCLPLFQEANADNPIIQVINLEGNSLTAPS